MKKYHIAYLFSALVFCCLDYLWLSRIASSFYQAQLGRLLAKPDIAAATLFYLVYVLGIVVFCVRPAAKANNASLAIYLGALLGLVAYGTYDLSNLAAIKGWSVRLSAIDMGWGILVTSLAAEAGFFAVRWFHPKAPDGNRVSRPSLYAR
jgi:uncharacterized membrane protein